MTAFLLGRKIAQTQFFRENGDVVPVTLIAAGPVTVTQRKTVEKDGYQAVQVGYGITKHVPKPKAGHLKAVVQEGGSSFRWLREFRVDDADVQPGSTIDVSVFAVGDRVTVRGRSKGKGFQGVVKRHGFHGGPASHGGKHNLRQPGSIGASWPERVRKGTRMAGRMGYESVTVKNLEVVHVDKEKNVLAVKGAVPGARGTLLEIRAVKAKNREQRSK